jgi:hypothetical protein
VYIGPANPTLVEVKILFYAMPFLLVEHALGQWVDCRACLHGNVGDDEAIVVERQVAVDGLGEDSVAVVEEEDCKGK